jgi:hypothetical protein
MADVPTRKGGIRSDPAVTAWRESAVKNTAAMSRKEMADRERVRVKLDVPPAIKARLAAAAAEQETSESQLGAFLLAWGLQALRSDDMTLITTLTQAKTFSHALRFRYDLEIPPDSGAV